MFFLIVFVFLSKVIGCTEFDRNIRLHNYEQYDIGYLDISDSCWKPFNQHTVEPIKLKNVELEEMLTSGSASHIIERNSQFISLISVSPSKEFSAIAVLFNNTNLDPNQKLYVSAILHAAEDLQVIIRKYTKLEIGADILPVLSDFITESCEPKIFDQKDRRNENIRFLVGHFLTHFNRKCEKYYLDAYYQIQIHPKIDLCLGIFLVLCLYYMHRNNLHFTNEKVIFIGAYLAFLMYDFKDRSSLYMAYQSYAKKYQDLRNEQANGGYLFFKFGD